MVFCSSCGTKGVDGSKFCHDCGAPTARLEASGDDTSKGREPVATAVPALAVATAVPIEPPVIGFATSSSIAITSQRPLSTAVATTSIDQAYHLSTQTLPVASAPIASAFAISAGAPAERKRTELETKEANAQKGRGSTVKGIDEKLKRDRSRDTMHVRICNSYWPEFDGLYVPKGGGSWDGLPQWSQLTAEEETKLTKQFVPEKGQGGNGIWWRAEGHWRIGRRNHYFYIAENTSDFPPATDEGAIWESAHGFYSRKGDQNSADKLCEKGHPGGKAMVQVTWELAEK
jgi:hypothetical protein